MKDKPLVAESYHYVMHKMPALFHQLAIELDRWLQVLLNKMVTLLMLVKETTKLKKTRWKQSPSYQHVTELMELLVLIA